MSIDFSSYSNLFADSFAFSGPTSASAGFSGSASGANASVSGSASAFVGPNGASGATSSGTSSASGQTQSSSSTAGDLFDVFVFEPATFDIDDVFDIQLTTDTVVDDQTADVTIDIENASTSWQSVDWSWEFG